MKNKNWLFVLFILIAALFAACSPVNSRTGSPTAEISDKAATMLPPQKTEIPTAVPPTEAPTKAAPPAVKLAAKQILEEQVSPPVSIKAEYPFMEEPAADKMFNEEVKKQVDEQILDIKKQAAEVEDWRAKTEPGFSSGTIIKYGVGTTEKGFVSVRLEISPFVAGAAHPNFFYIPINYDLLNHKFLSLSDLFKQDSNYLEKLANYCKYDLAKQGLQDFFPDGVLPKPENYRNWNFTGEGLLILFDPYQVAPWVAGPQKVIIPYAELQSIALPSGPLEVFAK